MKTFQEVITELAGRYNFDLSAPHHTLKLATNGDHHLHIEVQEDGILYVACFYSTLDNTLIADPGVLVSTSEPLWVVHEVHQDRSGGPFNPSSISGAARGGFISLSTRAEIAAFLADWAEALLGADYLSLEELL